VTRAPKGVGEQRAVARIDLAALSHNVGEIRRITGPDVRIAAVVKADAYGHGAAPVARHLVRCGVDLLATASFEEAVELRDAGITSRILVFGTLGVAEATEAVRIGITPTLASLESATALAAAIGGDTRLRVHVKVDTGMRRTGLTLAEMPKFAGLLEKSPFEVEGLYSHLSHADVPGHESLREQRTALMDAARVLETAGHGPRQIHLANSAGLLADRAAHLNMVRPGIALYGGLPHPSFAAEINLKPVMEVLSRVAQIRVVQAGDGVGYGHTWRAPRDSRIAVVPIGYGQGYLRGLSNRGYMMVRGRLAPVVGTVSMDHTMIDITAAGAVQPGDEVLVWGGPGEGAPDVMELAERAGSIGYELLVRAGASIPRTYVEPFG
jgi:alanine racemase